MHKSDLVDELEISNGYLDSQPFFEYMRQVLEVISGRMSVPEIGRALGTKYNERWIWDAIDGLLGSGASRKCWGVPSRYERSQPMTSTLTRNAPTRGKDLTVPLRESFPAKRKVTA